MCMSVLGLVAQSCPTLCDPTDCSPPGSSVHGILQARILEWVAFPSSGGSSQPRGWPQVSRLEGRFFAIWARREARVDIYPLGFGVPSSVTTQHWGESAVHYSRFSLATHLYIVSVEQENSFCLIQSIPPHFYMELIMYWSITDRSFLLFFRPGHATSLSCLIHHNKVIAQL